MAMASYALQYRAVHLNKIFLLGACSLLATGGAWIALPAAMAGSADLIRLLESKTAEIANFRMRILSMQIYAMPTYARHSCNGRIWVKRGLMAPS